MRSKHASCLPIVLRKQYSCPAAITQLGKYNCVINLNIHVGSLSYPSIGLDRCMKGSESRPTGFKGLRTRGLHVGSKAVTAIAAGRRTAWLPHPDNTSSSLNSCSPLLFQYETVSAGEKLLADADTVLDFFDNKTYFCTSHSSFTNRCTFVKTFITIYLKIRWLLHVSVYDHHQGACSWAWLKLYWY